MFARNFFYCFKKETGFRDGQCIRKSPAIIFPPKVKKRVLSVHCMATARVKSFMSSEKGGCHPLTNGRADSAFFVQRVELVKSQRMYLMKQIEKLCMISIMISSG